LHAFQITHEKNLPITQRIFVDTSEINDGDLKEICDKSYPGDEFDDESFIPVEKLGSAFIAELFHGPTFCFKDIG